MIDTAFWREAPLSEAEHELLRLLEIAHDASARRQNASTAAALNAYGGSGSYTNGLASALLTLGGLHGPIRQTVDLLTNATPVYEAELLLRAGRKVPGWGSSFVRGAPDPIWRDVAQWFEDADGTDHDHHSLAIIVDQVTRALHRYGKFVYPNPSAWTACTAIVLGLPAEFAPYLFVASRLRAWTQLMMESANVSR
jgi:citrate synthase